MRILLVEDERNLARVLEQSLSEEGHSVTAVHDGGEALDVAGKWSFDVIILDVMLPVLNGFAVARRLRAVRNQTPILMLTARDSTKDLIHGLDIGADDYLTKPFSLDVLFARVRALGRRGPATKPVSLQVGDLLMDLATREVRRGSRQIGLTPKEFSILQVLMEHAKQVLPRDTIIDAVWAGTLDVESNTLDAFIRLIRSKIEHPGETKILHTIRGIGYTLRE